MGPQLRADVDRVEFGAARPFDAPDLDHATSDDATAGLDLLDDVDLDVKIELGRTNMYIEDVLNLRSGSVVELDKLAGDPVDIYVNEKLVARGEGSLVTSLYSDDPAFVGSYVTHGGSTSGRLYIGSEKVAGQLPGSGLALPQVLHGGPARSARAGPQLPDEP